MSNNFIYTTGGTRAVWTSVIYHFSTQLHATKAMILVVHNIPISFPLKLALGSIAMLEMRARLQIIVAEIVSEKKDRGKTIDSGSQDTFGKVDNKGGS